jgi:DDE superfamily endonuclease
MPDLTIIDYGVGLPGSQHDASAWAETRIPKEHDQLFANDEWVWVDSAYRITSWCQAPYKR